MVLSVVLAQTLVTAWMLRRSYFFAEDFWLLAHFKEQPSDWQMLTTPIFGHLVPGFILVQQAFGSAFGASWLATSVATTLVQVGGTIAFARLLVALSGCRWWIPLLTAAYSLGVVTLNTTPWWSATTSSQITIVCSIATWGCALRFARTRRRRHLVSLLVMFVLAVAFFEKSIVVTAYLGLFVIIVGLDHHGSTFRERARCAVSLWPVWTILAIVALGDLAVYLTGTYLDSSGEMASGGVIGEYFLRALPEGVFPSVLGAVNPLSTLPGPAVLTPVVCTAIIVSVMIWTSWRSRLALRAWLWFFVVAVVSQAPVARGRLALMEMEVVVTNLRYQADTAYLLLIASAVAIPAAVRAARPIARHRATMAALLTPVLVLPLWAQSVAAISDNSPGKSSRAYFSQLNDGQGAGLKFLDVPVPEWVVFTQMYPWNMPSRIFPEVRPGTTVTNDPHGAYSIRFDGSIAPVTLQDLSRPSKRTRCFEASDGLTPMAQWDPESLQLPAGQQLLLSLDYARPSDAQFLINVGAADWQTDIRGTSEPFVVTAQTQGLTSVVMAPGATEAYIAVTSGRVCVRNVRLVTFD